MFLPNLFSYRRWSLTGTRYPTLILERLTKVFVMYEVRIKYAVGLCIELHLTFSGRPSVELPTREVPGKIHVGLRENITWS